MSDVPAIKTDPMADFRAKLQQRVRDDIRELLPADAVAALVEDAVKKEFFQPRRVRKDYGRDEERPSWFVEEVVKAAEPILREAVNKYIAEHPATVDKAIAEFLDQNRLAVTATSKLTDMLAGAIYSLQESLRR